jgi:hypothetical protein
MIPISFLSADSISSRGLITGVMGLSPQHISEWCPPVPRYDQPVHEAEQRTELRAEEKSCRGFHEWRSRPGFLRPQHHTGFRPGSIRVGTTTMLNCLAASIGTPRMRYHR